MGRGEADLSPCLENVGSGCANLLPCLLPRSSETKHDEDLELPWLDLAISSTQRDV